MTVTADFHNHSCLSPCGSLEMSPRVLVEEAAARGVQVLALTDHNSARNTPAFEILCRRQNILPLCGLEVTTLEELHCLCLFADSERALRFGRLVEARLTKIPLNPAKHGDQIVVDADEMVLEEVEFWLGAPTDIALTELGRLCHEHDGLFIPAHIDRASQSVFSQLGSLPPGPYDALEIRQDTAGMDVRGHTLVRGSDAHYPESVATRTCLLQVATLDFDGIRAALRSGWVS